MKKVVLLLACALTLAGSALAQDPTPARKPSGAIRENPAAEARHLPAAVSGQAVEQQTSQPALSERQVANGPAIPAGTAVRIKLQSAISTRVSNAGDAFSGSVTEPVVVNGKTIIPVGAALSGHITRVAEPRRIAGNPSLDLHPETVTLPDGQRFNITATVVDTGDPSQYTVTDEGRIKGKGRTRTDNVELVGGTGSGAVAGAVLGGGVGSLIGAAAGATVTTGHWLFKRHSAEIPAGTEIILEFSGPMSIEAGS